jgi:VanZ family protein
LIINEVKEMMSINWRGYRIAAYVGQFLLGVAVVVVLSKGNFQGALTLAGFLAASVAFVAWDRQLPNLFDFLFAIAALLNAGGWVWGWFYVPGPYDEIVHAFTTFSITLALSFLVYGPMLNVFREHRVLFVLAIASFGIAIGALWEVFEWVTGVINDLDDTITDLIMDTLGATIAAVLSLWALQERSRPESTAQDWRTSS